MKGLNWPSEQYSSQTRTFKEVLFLVFQIGKKIHCKGAKDRTNPQEDSGSLGPAFPMTEMSYTEDGMGRVPARGHSSHCCIWKAHWLLFLKK